MSGTFSLKVAPKITISGFEIFSGGTDTHLILLDLRPIRVTGKDAEKSMVKANLTCNKNGIPYDEEKPWVTSGIRLGTPACTTRGFGLAEFKYVGELVSELLMGLKDNKDDNSVAEKKVSEKVIKLCNQFPYQLNLN